MENGIPLKEERYCSIIVKKKGIGTYMLPLFLIRKKISTNPCPAGVFAFGDDGIRFNK